VVRKERVPVALALLFAREDGLATGVEVDGGVAFEAGKAHGGKVWIALTSKIPRPSRSQGERRACCAAYHSQADFRRTWT